MTEARDLPHVIEDYRAALGEFPRGHHEPAKALFSRGDDVSLGNPFGPFARGFEEVEQTMRRAASLLRDGEATGFDEVSRHVTDGLACLVQVEHVVAKVDGREELTPFSLRTTTLFRREGDTWKIAHRHADPITTPRAPESVLET